MLQSVRGWFSHSKKKVGFIFDHLLLPAIQNNTENSTLKSVSTGTIHISEFLNALSTYEITSLYR